MPEKKLFVVYLGGRIRGGHIELHDVRFVVGKTIESTIPTLVNEWIGERRGVHMDAYAELKEADGYAISLAKTRSRARERLYFVNVGGYDPSTLRELHDFGFFVASTAQEAKTRAKATLLQGAAQRHKDDLFDVDDCLPLEAVGGLHVQLTRLPRPNPWSPVKPDWYGYRVLSSPGSISERRGPLRSRH